jgi:hypothetical protein
VTADRLTVPASSGLVTRRAKAVGPAAASAAGPTGTTPSDVPATTQEAPVTQDLP